MDLRFCRRGPRNKMSTPDYCNRHYPSPFDGPNSSTQQTGTLPSSRAARHVVRTACPRDTESPAASARIARQMLPDAKTAAPGTDAQRASIRSRLPDLERPTWRTFELALLRVLKVNACLGRQDLEVLLPLPPGIGAPGVRHPRSAPSGSRRPARPDRLRRKAVAGSGRSSPRPNQTGAHRPESPAGR